MNPPAVALRSAAIRIFAMRGLHRFLLLALSAVLPAAAPFAAAQVPLEEQLNAIVQAHHGKVSVYAENLTTRQSVGIAPDVVVQTASVIKLAILYEALEQMRSGKVSFSDRLAVSAADNVPGSGLLHLLDAPATLTFKDALTLMIMMSDNEATNLAIDHLGLANINARSASLGLADTYLYKKVFTPVAPGTVLPPDFKRFGLGKTTARQIATLMTRIVTCDLATKALPAQPGDATLCATTLHMLQLQFYRSAIPRYLEALPGAGPTSIANKTGSLDAVRNDVAAIATPHGVIILACFTTENRDHSWGTEQEGELTIAKLARAVVSAWSPEGLAAWPAALPPAKAAPAASATATLPAGQMH